ncbi:general secretion pathway protein GspB [Shewanella cyperi]|uniref:General secretion pathway protein GspB n=1 Tax=Shewanella cyperi TaxID=2814292 RepID=A0A974XLV3_9GAMM|nr:general secretion pathway protein GspB [Shewanella cyperi]QSX30790.1 general secretion pathway protein GspB [Shewanella cyperi]
MSILLDAVSRSQQQQGDLLSSPRPLYEEPKNGLPLANLWLPAALTLAIASAWGLNHFLHGTEGSAAVTQAATQASAIQTSENEVQTQVSAKQPVSQQAAADTEQGIQESGVRLAGKVALPLSRSWQSQTPENQTSGFVQQSLEQKSPAQEPEGQNVEDADLARQTKLESESFDTEPDSEPIILGAGANQRGLDTLAALKQEVASAAAEVGLSQVQEKARPQVADAELVSAFQAALKEVEFDKSANQPVTEPKLDPIPAPKKDYPKYGELPAALQLRVPEFNINAHVYATAPNNRWLNVDGAELQQGDKIKGLLTIVEIRPRDVVLSIEGTEFKVPAI